MNLYDTLITRLFNKLKKKSTEALRSFISPSKRTLCHSRGNPMKLAEDTIEIEDKTIHRIEFIIKNSLLFLSLEPASFVFDEQTDPSPLLQKRLHICLNILDIYIGSFLLLKLQKD